MMPAEANNPADLFTKYLDETTNAHHTRNLGFKDEEGRAEDAPNLHSISIPIDDYQTGANSGQWMWLQYLTRNTGQWSVAKSK